MTPLLPHQHAALVWFLRRPEFAGLTADDAFARFAVTGGVAPPALKRLAATQFVSPEVYDRARAKGRPVADVMFACPLNPADFLTDHQRRRLDRVAEQNRRLERANPGLRLPPPKVPNNAPGMPNKLRREWFDRAWTEARG